MKLILMNGYPWPEQYSEGAKRAFSKRAGEICLELHGVVHFEWLHSVTVEFKDQESFDKAQALTGWKRWDSPKFILEAKTSSVEGFGHPAVIADVLYCLQPKTAYCGFMLLEE